MIVFHDQQRGGTRPVFLFPFLLLLFFFFFFSFWSVQGLVFQQQRLMQVVNNLYFLFRRFGE